MHKSVRKSRIGKWFSKSAGDNLAEITTKDNLQQTNKYRLNLEKELLGHPKNLDIQINKAFSGQNECRINSISTLKDTKEKILIELSISSNDKSATTEMLSNFVKQLVKPTLRPPTTTKTIFMPKSHHC